MANRSTDKAFVVVPGIADSEACLLETYGYTNAIILRSEGGGEDRVDAHLIIENSNYFEGDSTYQSAPCPSIALAKGGTSSTTLFIKYTSSATTTAWQAVRPSAG